APTGDAPTGDAPTGDAPTGDAPTGDAPTGDAPTGDAPTGDAPTGGAVLILMAGAEKTVALEPVVPPPLNDPAVPLLGEKVDDGEA
ncbi:MAG: hypothetical protein ACLBM1_11740, partial [Cuspidothrix sp.]